MKKLLPLFFIGLILVGCKKRNTPPPILPPGKATLTVPAKDAVCITGSTISDTQSSVAFAWNTSDNTDGYIVYIKNLLTGVTTPENAPQNQLTLPLLTNTPYSWYVVSISNKTTATAQSDIWKFYNSGPGVVTYAPFPAEITSPTFGQSISSTTVNLTWVGSVVNSDSILNYDVYFGTTNSPPLTNTVTNSFVNNVTVVSGTAYYWRVVTRDVNGNTSDSGLYQFSVN